MAEVSFWRFMRPVMWWPGVVLILGVLFYGLSAGVKWSEDALAADPVLIQAEVVEAVRLPPMSENGLPSYEVVLRVPGHGGFFTHRQIASQRVYEHARGAETIELWQQRDNPINLRFAMDWDPTQPRPDPRWQAAVPLGLGALLMGVLMWARLPAWRAVSGGDGYDAVITRHFWKGARNRRTRNSPDNTAEWTGRNGKPQTWKRPLRGVLPPVGSTIPVVIDPETGREFRADTL